MATEDEILAILTDELFSKDQATIPDAFTKIALICHSGDEAKEEQEKNARAYIVDVDGVGSMIRVMKKFPDDNKILGCAARALGSIMTHGQEDACMKIFRLGGAKIVVNAMKENLDIEDLQVNACGFIATFLFDSQDKSHEARMNLIVNDLDAIPTVCAAMKEHPNQRFLQQNAAVALYRICLKEENVAAVYKEGGCHLLVTALHNHEFIPTKKKFAKQTIAKLHDYLQNSV